MEDNEGKGKNFICPIIHLLFLFLIQFCLILSSEINATLRSTSYTLILFKSEFIRYALLKYPPKKETILSLPGVQHFPVEVWDTAIGVIGLKPADTWSLSAVHHPSPPAIFNFCLKKKKKKRKARSIYPLLSPFSTKRQLAVLTYKRGNMLFISVTPFKTRRLFRSHSSISAWQRSELRRAPRLTGTLAEGPLSLSQNSASDVVTTDPPHTLIYMRKQTAMLTI